MSRSKRGGKPTGWEYWGKRKGSYWVGRKTSHKMERMQLKEQDRKELEESLFEYGEGNYDLSKCPVYKSLFPNARTIEYYHHYICGYDVLVVDGKLVGYLTDALELLAYAYHTGENYTDRDDLEMKYYEHLDCGKECWGFLP